MHEVNFMNENELKSIERYFNKFNEDAASFNEFEANDFIKLLKNNGRNDDAIEVGNTFLQMAPSLKGYINQYGYALYNKFINIDDEKIKEKESLFFDILEDILGICKQEKYPSLEVITIFFRTTFKPFLSICRFYRLFLYF